MGVAKGVELGLGSVLELGLFPRQENVVAYKK